MLMDIKKMSEQQISDYIKTLPQEKIYFIIKDVSTVIQGKKPSLTANDKAWINWAKKVSLLATQGKIKKYTREEMEKKLKDRFGE